jgi:REP element-mobilizing transposase RayT
MTYDPDIHHRRSIRLKDYDYSQPGAYFVTVCTHNRECLFGTVTDGNMIPSKTGDIVAFCWHDLPAHYPHITIDAFVVMPNHIHGIIILRHPDNVGAGLKPAPTMQRHGLPEIVRGFKTFSARRINAVRITPGMPLWQRNYYEHVIRDERDLNAIREYIVGNPVGWDRDDDNPEFVREGLRPTPTSEPTT